MATIYNIKDLPKLADREIFVDANVLIYLNWSSGSAQSMKWEVEYAELFSKLKHQSNQLCIDFLVVSEVVNRMFKTEWKKRFSHIDNYKHFRDSVEGRQALTDIYLVVEEQVLSQFNVVGKVFSKDDIVNFFTIDTLDFMDKGIADICKENNYVLLTNDKDYQCADIEILTCL
ncbi:MAG: hypothetical protein LBU91_05790 [Bacteroidales bacterium]|jgi:predicted nucleic acid-binding protein|nr:hypothetical protein [Bacteroidales bacterium]